MDGMQITVEGNFVRKTLKISSPYMTMFVREMDWAEQADVAKMLRQAARDLESKFNGEDKLTKSAPEKLWLQADAIDESRDYEITEEMLEDLTWNYEPMGGAEICYVREDLA